jgi:hypothetical protein
LLVDVIKPSQCLPARLRFEGKVDVMPFHLALYVSLDLSGCNPAT